MRRPIEFAEAGHKHAAKKQLARDVADTGTMLHDFMLILRDKHVISEEQRGSVRLALTEALAKHGFVPESSVDAEEAD
jgi:hypothetical protein